MVFESNSYITGWQNQVAGLCQKPDREGGPSRLSLIVDNNVPDRVYRYPPLLTRELLTLTNATASAIAFLCTDRRRVKHSLAKNGD